MNADAARALLLEVFADVVPDANLARIASDAPYREPLGIDSMDFLAIIEQIAEKTGVEIAAADYPAIETFDGFVGYMAEHTA